jgi:hypothetical protein
LYADINKIKIKKKRRIRLGLKRPKSVKLHWSQIACNICPLQIKPSIKKINDTKKRKNPYGDTVSRRQVAECLTSHDAQSRCLSSFLQSERGREKSKLEVEKPDNHCQCWASRSTSVVGSHVNKMYPWHGIKMALHFCGLPPKCPQPSLIFRKTSDKSQSRDIVQNSWSKLSKPSEIRNIWETILAKRNLSRQDS